MKGTDLLLTEIPTSEGITMSLRDVLHAAAKDQGGNYLAIISSLGFPLTDDGRKALSDGQMKGPEALLSAQLFITALDEIASNHQAYGFDDELSHRTHELLDPHWNTIQELYLANRGQQTDELFASLRPIADAWLQDIAVGKEAPALVNKEY